MELAVVGGQRLRQTWHEQRQQLCRWLIIRFDGLENFYREERANIIDAERVGDFVETISFRNRAAFQEGAYSRVVGVKLCSKLPRRQILSFRMEERRVGKERVRKCGSRWWPSH